MMDQFCDFRRGSSVIYNVDGRGTHEIRSKRHEDSWLDNDPNSGKKRNHPWAEDRFDKEWALYALLSVPELEKENWGGKKSFAKGQLSSYLTYWFGHTFEVHRATLEKKGETDPYSDTDFVKFSQLREDGSQMMVVDTGLTQGLSKDLAPVYAFFRRLREEEKRPYVSKNGTSIDEIKPEWELYAWATKDMAQKRVFGGITQLACLSRDWPVKAPFEGQQEKFDPAIEIIDQNSDHLLEDSMGENHKRIQNILKDAGVKQEDYKAHLDRAMKRTFALAKRDMDIARMCCFRDKGSGKETLQFLLPLYLTPESEETQQFDVALVITRRLPKSMDIAEALRKNPSMPYDPNNFLYEVKTVLEPEMAYTNCRAMGRVRQAWLTEPAPVMPVAPTPPPLQELPPLRPPPPQPDDIPRPPPPQPDDIPRPPPPQPDTRIGGTVTRWLHEKFYGFIQPDDGGDSLICAVRHITDGNALQEGAKVRFVRAPKPDGRYEAKQVTGGYNSDGGGKGGGGYGGGKGGGGRG